MVESPGIHKHDFKRGQGKIQMTQKMMIPLFVIMVVKGAAKLTAHSKHVNMIATPIVGYSDQIHSQIL